MFLSYVALFSLGPYGSGKTVVCQKILEEVVKILDKEQDILYYIIHDQYSLLQAECMIFCDKLKGKYDIEIICLNHTQDEIKSVNGNFDLAECLDILRKGAPQGKNVHFFIDEYDTECLNESQCNKINDLNKGIFFFDSYIVIAVQSIEKNRKANYDGVFVDLNKDCLHLLNETMVEVSLTRVMRFTSNILDVEKLLQMNIENNVNTYQMFKSDEGGDDLNQDTPGIFNDVSIDRTYKELNIARVNKLPVLGRLESTFKYLPNTVCGHSIEGNLPSLIRLPIGVDKAVVGDAIEACSKPQYKRNLFICTDSTTVDIAYQSAEYLGLKVIPYLDGLTLDISGRSKMDVYKEWIGTRNCVLLTDNHGCRGLQNGNVKFLQQSYCFCFFCTLFFSKYPNLQTAQIVFKFLN